MKKVNDVNYTRWLISTAGVLLLGLGIWVIVCPFESYLSMALILAAVILVTGILEILFSVLNFKSIEDWGWILLSGLIDFAVGGYLLLYPLITMAVLPLVIGLWLLFRSFSTILSGLELRRYKVPHWGWYLVAGLLLIFLSLAILTNPIFGIINLVYFTGVSLIWAGIFRISLGFKLPKMLNRNSLIVKNS